MILTLCICQKMKKLEIIKIIESGEYDESIIKNNIGVLIK